MTTWLEDEDEGQTETPAGEVSEEEARERRYQEEAAQKLTKGGGLDEPPRRLHFRLIVGTAASVLLGGIGAVAYAMSTAKHEELGREQTVVRKPLKLNETPAALAGRVEPAVVNDDAYDQVDPSDPVFTTPVTTVKPAESDWDELHCPAEYSPSECIALEQKRMKQAGDPTGAKMHASYAANVGKETRGSDWEDEGMLAPMGYFGGTKHSPSFAASAPSAAPEMAPMGMSSHPGLQLPGNLTAALEKAAQGSSQDPDDVKEAFAARPGTLDGVDDERELGACELTAGTVIHVANLSAINTDVPAKSSVTAQVTQTVRCGSDNQYVAIPQGSTFTASANSRVSYGDERIQLCMEQLKRPPSRDKPNGSVVPVKCWAAADITGMVGWTGEVDNHWDKLIAGVALSTFLSLGTTSAAGNQEGFAPTIAQRAATQAGMQINQAGQRIAQRELQRKPTITRKMLQPGTVIITENKPMTPWVARKAKRRTW